MKLNFYELLENSDEFCRALGKAMLVASKLEILIKQYLRLHGNVVPEKRATLGNLIDILRRNGHLTINGEIHFGQAGIQRNYLIHNLYGSFVDEIEEKLLPVDDLVEMDVEIYTDQVQQTITNFEAYVTVVQAAIEQHNNNRQQDTPGVAPLL